MKNAAATTDNGAASTTATSTLSASAWSTFTRYGTAARRWPGIASVVARMARCARAAMCAALVGVVVHGGVGSIGGIGFSGKVSDSGGRSFASGSFASGSFAGGSFAGGVTFSGGVPHGRVGLLGQVAAWMRNSGSAAAAAEFDAGKLSALRARMQAFVDQKQLSGAVTVVGNEKGIVSFEAVGMANIAQQRPMAPDTLFRIASMTKPITALAVMMLVDEGKVSVDAPVEKYLPEFTGQLLVASKADGVTTLKRPSRPITVRDLMTHTSGLPGGFPAGVGDLYGRRHLSLAEAVLVSSQQPLDFEPGAKWAYCNAGIDALGRIVESVAGEPFETFVERRIFKPLGMTDTYFYPPADRLPKVASVYDAKDGQLVEPAKLLIGPTVGARHPIPAGGLYSTGGDLARLYQAMLAGGKLGESKIVSPESLAAMTKVQTGDLACGFVPGMGFGYGWAVVRQPQDVTAMLSPGTFGHGGAFGTQGWIDPQRGLFVILLIQRVGLKNGDASDMRRELQRIAVDAIK